MALGDKGFWQRLDYIRQAACLGKRQPLRCYKKNSHLFSVISSSAWFFYAIGRPWLRQATNGPGPRTQYAVLAVNRATTLRFLLRLATLCAQMPRQRLGQHFLADPGWREEIARAIRVSPQSLAPSSGKDTNAAWIEIGPGHGEMTEHLASTGAPVYAIELDP